MIKKIFFLSTLLVNFFILSAQVTPTTDSAVSTSKTKVKFSGSMDAYYSDGLSKATLGNLTSFTNSEGQLGFGMASLKGELTSGNFGFVADIAVGKRGKEFAYNDKKFWQPVKQLYAYYSVKGVKLTVGTWATHLGYELVDPQLNKNYTMSYMFTNGPFTHTGIKADYTKGKHSFMGGVSKATDFRDVSDLDDNKLFIIAQYSYAFNDNDKVYINYVGGKNADKSTTNQFDVVATKKLRSKLVLRANVNMNMNKATGSSSKACTDLSAYLGYDAAKWLSINYRTELFSDKKQAKMFVTAPKGGSIFANTLSANLKAKNFTFIPEVRIDNATETIFKNKAGVAKKSVANLILAAVLYF